MVGTPTHILLIIVQRATTTRMRLGPKPRLKILPCKCPHTVMGKLNRLEFLKLIKKNSSSLNFLNMGEFMVLKSLRIIFQISDAL